MGRISRSDRESLAPERPRGPSRAARVRMSPTQARSGVRRLLVLAAVGLAAGCGSDQLPKIDGTGGTSTTPIVRPGGSGGGEGGSGGVGGGGGAGGSGGVPQGPLRIDAVRPPRGMQAGGETVIIQGAGFHVAGKTTITFGANPVIGARVVDDGTIYLSAPPGSLGAVDVKVSNADGEAVCAGCYRYLEPVAITSVEPSEGSLYGGSPITLRGRGLREGMVVTFGSRAALDVASGEDGSLSMLLPPGDEEGLVDVRVFDEDGQAFARKAFGYVGRLQIDSIDPPGGALPGGNRIQIHGRGFGPAPEVFIDEVKMEATMEGPDVLSVIAPSASAAGAVSLEVRTRSAHAAATYAYFDPSDTTMRLYALSPQRGAVEGGEAVTLVGTGLDQAQLAVRFGDALAIPAFAGSSNFIQATTPAAEAALAVDVEARLATGRDALPAAFRYVASIEVHSLSPSFGPTSGGTAITVRGEGFPEGARLFVGALEATQVVRSSSTTITAITPRGTDGDVPVRVVSPEDPESEGILAYAFTYEGPFTLSVVDPPLGARAGGTQVTLRGRGFQVGMDASFGAVAATSIEVLDPYTAVALTPRGNTGIVDVGASREDGAAAMLAGAFTYVDPATSSGGSSGGPLNGNLNVTALNGSREAFGEPLEGALVILGSEDGTQLQGLTDNRGQVTISSPILVKPQTVTVSLENFETASVVKQQSENLTVLLQPNGGDGDPPPPPPPEPPPGVVTGKVWGFKRPPHRSLGPTEREVAFVRVGAARVYDAYPFNGNRIPEVRIDWDGGSYAFSFRGSATLPFYAVYGILDEMTQDFDPLLMGVVRSVPINWDTHVTADIILDTRLDLEVPVTVLNPPALDGWSGTTEVHAFLDLGGDGVIPVGIALTTDALGSLATLTKLPHLSGDSFLFSAWGGLFSPTGAPLTATFRRQSGDLRSGLTIGPLMGVTRLTQPAGVFTGVIEWERSPGPEPEISFIEIAEPGMFGDVPQWHIVVPGSERRVTMPASMVNALRDKYEPGSMLKLTLIQGREPRFGFDQWAYDDTSIASYTSFTFDGLYFAP